MAEPEWITNREAAEILGVQPSAIPKMIRRGDLVPRPRRRPQLERAAVVELAAARARAATEAERRRAEREAKRAAGPRPPDDEHDWLLIVPAAAVLGISRGTLSNRVVAGRVPCTLHAGRRWFRVDHLEALLRARHLERTMR